MIKAIETKYKGCRFRSRLEARWAVFFDACGIKWEYEPEGFILDDGTKYLPDFKIYDIYGNFEWVEVKPEGDSFTKAYKFAESGNTQILCLDGLPDNKTYDMAYSFRMNDETADQGIQAESAYFMPVINSSENKMYIGWGYEFHLYGWWRNDIPYGTKIIQAHELYGNKIPEYVKGIQVINNAIEAAKSARFEFGEAPK